MKKIYETSDQEFKIEFNGSSTYFVSNTFDCIGYFSTERKALNFLKRTLSYHVEPPEVLKIK